MAKEMCFRNYTWIEFAGCKPAKSPIESNLKLSIRSYDDHLDINQDNLPLTGVNSYRKLGA